MLEFYNRKFRSFFMTKFLVIFAIIASLQFSFAADAQRINLIRKNAPLKEIFNDIKKQTGYTFVYLTEILKNTSPVTIQIKNGSLQETLEKCLDGQNLDFTIKAQTVVISKKIIKSTAEEQVQIGQQQDIRGRVIDKTGQGIPMVTVTLKGTSFKTSTDAEGRFKLAIAAAKDKVLMFTFIGFQSKEVVIKDPAKNINVTLEESVEMMKDAVITGIYTRTKESFTGSSATYTAKELKMIGNQNILQSLRTLDPAFAILSNNRMGSDPNSMPDINVRGKTSVIGLSQEYENDPNQPLFILDGFESTLKVINDLNIDRVESITVLKDAAATAIYGSRSANGVIVVETKRPEAGTLKVNYNLNTSFSFADLSDYNLMNSTEKLEFERLSGYYGTLDANDVIMSEPQSVRYNTRLAETKRGVDTYWMNEPLRFAINQSHNIFAEGGDDRMRYGIGFTYGNTQGVMKGSDRTAINGNIRLVYRYGNLSFTNYLNIDQSTAFREAVPFSSYSAANPYFRKYGVDGSPLKILETITGSTNRVIYSPMYDASINNINKSPSFGFRNNFDVDWRAISSLRVRGRFSLEKTNNNTERFIAPSASQFDGTVALEKGTYTATTSEGLRYNADLSTTFGKLFGGKHMLNAVLGLRFDHSGNVNNGYTVRGFMEDSYSNPAFSNGFQTGSKPSYTETERRSASYYSNMGYSYDNRYQLDANFRSDGSSLFGVSNQFTTTWATGLGWNIHNEQFFKKVPLITYLKLRASVGNPGNQNFDSRMTMNIYSYNPTYPNPFGLSALISSWGNHNLDWQRTIDKNIGMDIEVLDRKLRLNFDYFNKNTDPLLVFVDVPVSTGTSTVPKNMGAQLTKGMSASMTYQIFRKNESMWSVNANVRDVKMEYRKIGNNLDRLNQENKSRSLQRYYDGGSPTDLWAVRSAGIDPATGREIFIKKDGTQTFLHDFNDEVIVGNTDPKLEGVVGTSFYYKRFSVALNFRYKLGGQIFQSVLYNKVENLSITDLANNQDKRALYDRWQKPGDNAKFKGISLLDETPMSSRFVTDENVFSAESISMSYDIQAPWLKILGISSLNVRGYMNEIFRISNVKEERGIDYPFARSVSFSLGARF